MRNLVRTHAPVITGFATMLCIALLMGTTLDASLPQAPASIVGLPGPPIDLPHPSNDVDRDGHHDDVDLFAGDLSLRIVVEGMDTDARAPYLLVHTDDDAWRLGAELEWPHIVDADPLGHKPGSAAWKSEVLQTGASWRSLPLDGASRHVGPIDANHTQVFHVNVRDDRPMVRVTIAVNDAGRDPDRHLGAWTITYDVAARTWNDLPDGSSARLAGGDSTIDVQVTGVAGISLATQHALAQQWAPTIRFSAGEQFFPLPGETLQQFHGFAARTPDHRTWTRDFNNGRDHYLFFVADFNGDRKTDHRDAAIMTELLRAGGQAPPTVYAHVANATGDHVIIQYWMLYAYNHVPDVDGDDIQFLTHSGDREFIQLRFASLQDALVGQPIDVAYSQHYKGIRLEGGQGVPEVYVARGSHASFPSPGDDRRLRPAFIAYGDIFDGEGPTWDPSNYTVEVLSTQPWHLGYKWGPITRHHRDLGTPTAPLLQHSFEYPFIDPMSWHMTREVVHVDDLETRYGP